MSRMNGVEPTEVYGKTARHLQVAIVFPFAEFRLTQALVVIYILATGNSQARNNVAENRKCVNYIIR